MIRIYDYSRDLDHPYHPGFTMRGNLVLQGKCPECRRWFDQAEYDNHAVACCGGNDEEYAAFVAKRLLNEPSEVYFAVLMEDFHKICKGG